MERVERAKISRVVGGLAIIATGSLITGCSVGPDYQMPELSLKNIWSAENVEPKPRARDEQLANWWKAFNDPVLDQLIEKALTSKDGGNLDLLIATERVLEARASLVQANAAFLPSLDLIGSFSRTKRSDGIRFGSRDSDFQDGGTTGVQNIFSAGFDTVWEMDVFGEFRRGREAALAELAATEERARGARVSLIGELGKTYIDYRAFAERLAIANRNIKTQEESLKLTRSRFEAGLVSELDVSQANAQLASTAAQIPTLEASKRAAAFRLALLVGEQPGSLDELLSKESPIPAASVVPEAGLPSDLLRQRPDIRAAERDLAGASARIGVATAQLFPKVQITAGFGLQSNKSGNLIDASSQYWNFTPGVRLPLIGSAALMAGVDIAEAQERQALFTYTKTVLQSLEETENALIAYDKEKVRHRSLLEAESANRRSVELARDLYREGLIDFLRVLEAERSLYASEDLVAQSRSQMSSNLVALYKALGGGWQVAESAS